LQDFEGALTIYWSPQTGAHEVGGPIKQEYDRLKDAAIIDLGFPITDEIMTHDRQAKYNNFQHGAIYWTPKHGAHEVHGDILNKWLTLFQQGIHLGYPITNELTTPDGTGRYNHNKN
jgi:uncharacterized protein with LGFP repeats